MPPRSSAEALCGQRCGQRPLASCHEARHDVRAQGKLRAKAAIEAARVFAGLRSWPASVHSARAPRVNASGGRRCQRRARRAFAPASAASPAAPGPRRSAQQDRLQLIVGVMRREQRFVEGAAPARASARSRAAASGLPPRGDAHLHGRYAAGNATKMRARPERRSRRPGRRSRGGGRARRARRAAGKAPALRAVTRRRGAARRSPASLR